MGENEIEGLLDPRILRAVREMGFENFSPIQEQAMPFLFAGEDLIGQTGTGKTAASWITCPAEAMGRRIGAAADGQQGRDRKAGAGGAAGRRRSALACPGAESGRDKEGSNAVQ